MIIVLKSISEKCFSFIFNVNANFLNFSEERNISLRDLNVMEAATGGVLKKFSKLKGKNSCSQ